MASFLIPILMVVAAGGLFLGYIAPGYDGVKVQRAEIQQYDDALARFEQLKKLRDELNESYKQFTTDDVGKLIAILPDNLENIRFALDLDSLATKNRVKITTLEIAHETEEPVLAADGTTPVDDSLTLGSATLKFDIEGSYVNMVAFLTDLERNLRLVDITDFSFTESTADSAMSYEVGVRMYWLK
jgi:hypothetical protein